MQLFPPPQPPGTPSNYGSPRTVTMYDNQLHPIEQFLGPRVRKRWRNLGKSIAAILRYLSEPLKYILHKTRRLGRNFYYTRRRTGYVGP